MLTKKYLSLALLLILLFSVVLARGGGGCFLSDTQILLSNGNSKQISTIEVGDNVKAFDSFGDIVDSKVNEIFIVDVNSYFILKGNKFEEKVTGEHPFYVGDGLFKTVGELTVGEKVFIFSNGKLLEDKITLKEEIFKSTKVYNLKTGWPNTYFANLVAVHNKGGGGGSHSSSSSPYTSNTFCGVDENILVDGNIISGKECIYVYYLKSNSSFTSELSSCVSTTSGVQGSVFDACLPLASSAITTKAQFKCSFVGQCDGLKSIQFPNNRLVEVVLPPTALQLFLETMGLLCFALSFICFFLTFIFLMLGKIFGGFKNIKKLINSIISILFILLFISFPAAVIFFVLSTVDLMALIFVILFFVPFGLVFFFSVRKGGFKLNNGGYSGNLDYLYPSKDIDSKAKSTSAVIAYLSNKNKWWNQKTLIDTAKKTFLKLQECWQKRDYVEMKPLMMTNLYNQHLTQIKGMINNHEINIIGNLSVKRVNVINVRSAGKEEQNEFTVLIEASATDYYVDDRDNNFLRGDSSRATFQEFWVFQRFNGKWLLREINQTRESDALREDNFVEEITPEQMKKLYSQAGVVGEETAEKAPWMEAGLTEKSNKIYRMLNFLSATDKSWDESFMKEEARRIFTTVSLAVEKRDASGLEEVVLPNELKEFESKIDLMIKNKSKIELRNFCVRKVDIVLVNNYNDNNADEFVARIAAHAQWIETANGKTIRKDSYVTPYEEYWTFQKLNGKWMLEEAHPSKSPAEMIKQENYDEESSKDQVKWYYTKERA